MHALLYDKITAISASADGRRPLKLQTRQIAVDMVVCSAGDLREFRASELCEIEVVRAGHHVHSILIFFLQVENVLKSAFLTEHLSGQRIPYLYKQASHPGQAQQHRKHFCSSIRRFEGGVFYDPVGAPLPQPTSSPLPPSGSFTYPAIPSMICLDICLLPL